MKNKYRFTILLSFIFLFFLVPALYAQSGRICGMIHTRDGEIFEGPIRWDKNEACWDDIINATKERENARRSEGRQERHIQIFGLHISWDEDKTESRSSSGIQFGYLKSLERKTGSRAVLELKNGDRVTFYGGGTDIGSGIREIMVDDPVQGEVWMDWDDLDWVEFRECSPDTMKMPETRLYGTVETRRGDVFKGFITWDVDELFYSDILDGEEKDHTRKIPFGKIKSIERRSSSSAWVTLRNGDRMRLSGTNDIDSGNRGIMVHDPDYGWVTVDWDDFDRMEILDEGDKHPVRYDQFPEIKPLMGVVYDEDGKRYEGKIRWDNDETESWELLDGEYKDLDIDVEFSQIDRIEKVSSRSAKITLKNGNSFKLSGSNDVNDENKGIYVTTRDGDEIQLDWEDFDRAEFK
jgi:hypothetical protein